MKKFKFYKRSFLMALFIMFPFTMVPLTHAAEIVSASTFAPTVDVGEVDEQILPETTPIDPMASESIDIPSDDGTDITIPDDNTISDESVPDLMIEEVLQNLTPSEPTVNTSDNATQAENVTDVITTEEPTLNTDPVVTISSPTEGTAVVQSDSILLSGIAIDNEDGILNITWTSSIAGELGTGNELSITNLSEGTHTVTATVTDSKGGMGTAEVIITVMPFSETPSEPTITPPDDGTAIVIPDEDATQHESAPDVITTEEPVLETALDVTNSSPTEETQTVTASVTDSQLLATSIYYPNLINDIWTSDFPIPSPDPSDITYNSKTGTFWIVDSEVDEMSIYKGVNLYEMDMDGNLVSTANTTRFSYEPTGIAYNAANDNLFFTDDDKRRVFEMNRGPDLLYGTSDDIITSFRTSTFGSYDPEDLAFDSATGVMFIVDGVSNKVYQITSGTNSKFDGIDDIVTQFDTVALGVTVPEGIDYNSATGSLYIVGAEKTIVAEATKSGLLVRTIDISVASGTHLGGLGIGPSSANPAETVMYVTDRGIDNDRNPNENDGRIYELTLPSASPSVNTEPIVTITSPTSGSNYTTGANIIFEATVSDDKDSGLAISWVSSINGQIGTGGSLSTAALSIGIHTITASATDSQGLIGKATITVTVTSPSVNTEPIVTITSPTSGSNYTTGANIIFEATVSDDKDSGLAISWVSSINGQIGTGGSLSTAVLSTGIHTITASATDSQGLIGKATITVTVTSSGTNPSNFTSGMINDIWTFDFPIPSPDPSDITYNSKTGTFWIVDSEVDEMGIYKGVNLYEMDMDGNLVSTANTTRFSYEPTGIAYNAANDNLFFTDDDKRKVYEMNRGPDLLYGTSDDIITSFRTSTFGSTDPQDIAFDSATGIMFIVDGVSNKIYQITSGTNGKFDGIDDIVTQFDTVALGVTVPEGIGYNSATGSLYIVGAEKTIVAEATKSGLLVRTIDISVASGTHLGGLGIGPSSANPAETVMYVTDRGIDNDRNPNENDGRIYELTLPSASPSVNTKPIVTITSPTSGSNYTTGANIIFEATVSDDKDSGLAISWVSSINGQIGTGGSLSTAALSTGIHTITASATDSQGLIGKATITVTVTSSGTNPSNFTSVMINDIWSFDFPIPSPDPSDITYNSKTGTFWIVDSEVDEMSIYKGVNLYEMDMDGNLVSTANTTRFSYEPTGIVYNAANDNLFFTDDDKRRVYEMDRGPDLLYGTSDDIITSFRTSTFGSTDPEDIAFDSATGVMFIADGVNNKVFQITSGTNGKFDGIDDIVTQFDTVALGVTDPEGIGYNSATGNLYIVGNEKTIVAEVTKSGLLVRTIDISVASGEQLGGLGIGPSSANPAETVMYVTDRGIDNDQNPNENDGRIYELSLPLA